MSAVLSIAERELIVAMHEAGHVVACVRLGVPFSSVSIDYFGPGRGAGVESEAHFFPAVGSGGSDRMAREGDDDLSRSLAAYIQRCRQQVVVCLAGRAAEERAALFGLTRGVGVESDLKDLRDARYFLREAVRAEDADPRQADSKAVGLETRPAQLVSEMAQLRIEAAELISEHFSYVRMVADLLVAKKRLTAVEVAQIVCLAGPADNSLG